MQKVEGSSPFTRSNPPLGTRQRAEAMCSVVCLSCLRGAAPGRRSQVVRQRSAKPPSPVRLRSPPPTTSLHLAISVVPARVALPLPNRQNCRHSADDAPEAGSASAGTLRHIRPAASVRWTIASGHSATAGGRPLRRSWPSRTKRRPPLARVYSASGYSCRHIAAGIGGRPHETLASCRAPFRRRSSRRRCGIGRDRLGERRGARRTAGARRAGRGPAGATARGGRRRQ